MTAYTLAVFAVAALPGYLLAAAAIERPGITYFFTDFGPTRPPSSSPLDLPGPVRATCHGAAGSSVLSPTRTLSPACCRYRAWLVSGLVAGVAATGLILTVAFLPEPKEISLEQLADVGN